MGKRSKRKRREGGGKGSPPARTAVAEPAILATHERSEWKRRSAFGNALVGYVMLARCGTFTAEPVPETGEAKVVPMGHPVPIVCPGCGRDPGAMALKDCPNRISREEAMLVLLPPEVLHAEPEDEPGIVLPPGAEL